jgi:transposase
MPTRRPYPIDLSNEEWQILEPLVSEAKPGDHPRTHAAPQLLKAGFYFIKVLRAIAPDDCCPTKIRPGRRCLPLLPLAAPQR